ncbi:MAG: hypothetical protein U1F77_04105 [Kiritimatiellia bacterium]
MQATLSAGPDGKGAVLRTSLLCSMNGVRSSSSSARRFNCRRVPPPSP